MKTTNTSLRRGPGATLMLAHRATMSSTLALGLLLSSGAIAADVAISTRVTSPDFAAAYDKTHRRYSAAYYRGQANLSVGVCGAIDANRVSTYQWSISQAGQPPMRLVRAKPAGTDRPCDEVFVVPADADYVVQVELGMRDGRKVEGRNNVKVGRPLLIVSLGDSYASGEGNPDIPGAPTECSKLHCEGTTVTHGLSVDVEWNRKPQWLEPRANRSLKSGPALAAAALARSGRLVNFITLAATGATSHDLRAQLVELKSLHGEAPERRIDALVVSTGGNDVGFSGALEEIAKTKHFSELESGIRTKIAQVPAALRKNAGEAIASLNPRVVLWTGYPTSFFEGSDGAAAKGCGLFDTRESTTKAGVGVTQGDAQRVKDTAELLNKKIAEFANEQKFRFVRVDGGFERHGYCSRESYFVHAEEACKKQGQIGKGTMHPNAKGHRVYAREILAELRSVPGALTASDKDVVLPTEDDGFKPRFSDDESKKIASLADAFRQWSIGTTQPRGEILPGLRYSLVNYRVDGKKTRFLQYESSGAHGGINLGWTDDSKESTGDRVSKWFFERQSARPGYGEKVVNAPLKYGERVALGLMHREGLSDPYLRYGHRDWGINLKWSKEPIFEWTVLGGPIGTPVAAHQRVTIFNLTHDNFMIYFPRDSVGPSIKPGNIGWPDSTAWGWGDVLDVPGDVLGWAKNKGWGAVKGTVKAVGYGVCLAVDPLTSR